MARNTSTFSWAEESKIQSRLIVWVFDLCFLFASILYACLGWVCFTGVHPPTWLWLSPSGCIRVVISEEIEVANAKRAWCGPKGGKPTYPVFAPPPKKNNNNSWYHDYYMFIIITFTLSESSKQTQTPKGMDHPKRKFHLYINNLENSGPFVVKFMKGSFAWRPGAPIHHTFNPEVADLFPYTFSKISRHRWYQSGSKYW